MSCAVLSVVLLVAVTGAVAVEAAAEVAGEADGAGVTPPPYRRMRIETSGSARRRSLLAELSVSTAGARYLLLVCAGAGAGTEALCRASPAVGPSRDEGARVPDDDACETESEGRTSFGLRDQVVSMSGAWAALEVGLVVAAEAVFVVSVVAFDFGVWCEDLLLLDAAEDFERFVSPLRALWEPLCESDNVWIVPGAIGGTESPMSLSDGEQWWAAAALLWATEVLSLWCSSG